MKKTIIFFVAALSGCTGASVTTVQGPNGAEIKTAHVSGGTTMTYNKTSGDICVDAAGKDTCQCVVAQP